MKKTFYGNLKVGILGGGQLGRMWIQNALNYNVTCAVIDPDANAPCKNICDQFTVGDITDFDTVYNFGQTVDLITIEIEKVNVEALEKLESEGKLVYPQPSIIKMIRDKGVQKQWMKDHGIPTSDFQLIENKEALEKLVWGLPYVQKLRKDGYDGKGVQIIREKKDFDDAFTAPSLVERLVDFEKEIAVIVARNADGETKTFPLVEMDFHPTANLVEFLVSPANVSEYTAMKAENLAVKIADELELVGLLAVEMFLTKSGDILVNEMAPRPHNSGHQTIEGNVSSQFEQHLRAIFNQPLGNTDAKYHSVMINILGEEGHTGDAVYEGMEEVLNLSGVYVHLYGKKITKPFRKMGHVTVVDESRDEAIRKARMVKEVLRVVSPKN
jgi:5-(carboxyamino)imidazole ribonucleotide synthase